MIIMWSKSNKLFFILMYLVCIACEDQKVLTKEHIDDIKTVLNCESISEKKEGDFNFIEVENSKLKTSFGKEMGASVSSLILYERTYVANSSLDFDSYFGVRFLEDSSEYVYSLNTLSSTAIGKKKIESILNKVLVNREAIGQIETYSSFVEQNSIIWSKVNIFGILGFEFAKVNYSDEELDCILFRYFLEPNNKEVWIYYSSNKDEIVSIIDPLKSIGS